MLYSNNNLVLTLLIENTSKKNLFGIFRPSAYMKESGNYFSALKIDLFKKPIEPGDDCVVTGILEAPVGYGNHIKEGTLMILKNGYDEVARAVILEINGFLK